jgi:serine/threonine-protein kinase
MPSAAKPPGTTTLVQPAAAAPEEDRLLGTVVANYRIERLLAKGGNGVVFVARHVHIETKEVVVKVMLDEIAKHPECVARFYDEAAILMGMSHPRIAEVENFGVMPDGAPYLVGEYLKGITLWEYLGAGRRMPHHEVLRVVAQIASGLQYAHDRGIVHRDIKPENIFVIDPTPGVMAIKILDFGLAKVRMLGRPDHTQVGRIMGTPLYMATEQHEHAETATALADVYALGVVGWQMKTGYVPFPLKYTDKGEPDLGSIYHAKQMQRPFLLNEQEMWPGWIEVLTAAMHPNKAMRPQSMSRFAVQLAKATRAQPPSNKDGMAVLEEAAKDLLTAPRGASDETVKAPNGAPLIHGAPGGGYASTLSGAAGAVPTGPRRRAMPGALAALVVAGAAIGGGIALSRGGAAPAVEAPKASTVAPVSRGSAAPDAALHASDVASAPPDAPSATPLADAATVTGARVTPTLPIAASTTAVSVTHTPAHVTSGTPAAPPRRAATPSRHSSPPSHAPAVVPAVHDSATKSPSPPASSDDDFDPEAPMGRRKTK